MQYRAWGFLMTLIVAQVFFGLLSHAFCGDANVPPEDVDAIIRKIAEQTFGAGKLLRIDPQESSPLKGLHQRRIWTQSPYGERPYLIYVDEEKGAYFIGSIYDATGKNITEATVGSIIPKKVSAEVMCLNDDYRIGLVDAPIKAVLWIGTDISSKFIFDKFYEIYKRNKSKMSIYIKFFPRGDLDLKRMKGLTCFRGEEFESALLIVLNSHPSWGSDRDISLFKEARGIAPDTLCNETVIQQDLTLAARLNLPSTPSVFINDVMFLDSITSENITRVSGILLD